MDLDSVLLVGATGLVGSHCQKLLLKRPDCQRVTVLARRPLEATDARVQQMTIRFEELRSIQLPPMTSVFCALGTTIRKAGSKAAFREVDFEYPRLIARQALAAGAKQFLLVSAVDAEPGSRNFYLRVKGELEHAIAEMPFASLHIFRPGFLLGERRERRRGETAGIAFVKVIQPLLRGSFRRYHSIPAETVAAAMIGAAQGGERGCNIYHYDGMLALSRRYDAGLK
ncbi:MAG: NAD(P)H-binding protein [Bryobacteraceae bacterium]